MAGRSEFGKGRPDGNVQGVEGILRKVKFTLDSKIREALKRSFPKFVAKN